MKETILKYIERIEEEIIAVRRYLHQHPELSFEEVNTSRFIFEKLQGFGLEPQIIGKTGVVAVIKNEQHDLSKGCVALRADIDALPITERTGLSFASQNEGVMHACGHDVHASVLLGTAKVLYQFKEHLEFPVKLIFQPGEEKLPGGASLLIKEGVLENPKVNRIFGLHVAPELKVGELGWRKGIYMASCDEIYIDIHGKGGHGALPQNCVDPIVIGASLILNLQQVISRKADPRVPNVLSFGYFEGIGATNVIPSEVKIKGTFRTFDENWRSQAHEWIRKYVHSHVESAGGTVDLLIEKGYPFLKNDSDTVDSFLENMTAISDQVRMVELDIRMTSEDFSYYSQEIPACFFRLGTSNNDENTHFSVHHPQFCIDERAIFSGIKAFCFNMLNI